MKPGKIVGVGNTATVYKWDSGRVIKLFNKDYPENAVIKEFNNALAINEFAFSKPKVYEVIKYNDRHGIIYDYVEGESLHNWVIRTEDIDLGAFHMSNLHLAILGNKLSNVPYYKDFLKSNILRARNITEQRRNEALDALNKLPDGNSLCHGDFHPGNIFLSHNDALVIDFMNVCKGNYLYDIARTVFLVEYTPVPKGMENRDSILLIKKRLADIYLSKMNVTRVMIRDFLKVITIARVGECPNENICIDKILEVI